MDVLATTGLEQSWPPKRLAAVAKRALFVGRYLAKALNSADRSVMGVSGSKGQIV